MDLLRQAGATLQTEANAVTDNPLILSDGDIVSGGNFHAEPVAFAADQIALAISEIGCIAQRRVSLLVDPKLNFGLPAFLASNPGLNSGLMVAEVTSAALMSENKAMANPRSIDSTPTSADQEDHVSMGSISGRKCLEVIYNLEKIIAVELLNSAQSLEYRRPNNFSKPVEEALGLIRKTIKKLDQDKVLSEDINLIVKMIKNRAFNVYPEL